VCEVTGTSQSFGHSFINAYDGVADMRENTIPDFYTIPKSDTEVAYHLGTIILSKIFWARVWMAQAVTSACSIKINLYILA